MRLLSAKFRLRLQERIRFWKALPLAAFSSVAGMYVSIMLWEYLRDVKAVSEPTPGYFSNFYFISTVLLSLVPNVVKQDCFKTLKARQFNELSLLPRSLSAQLSADCVATIAVNGLVYGLPIILAYMAISWKSFIAIDISLLATSQLAVTVTALTLLNLCIAFLAKRRNALFGTDVIVWSLVRILSGAIVPLSVLPESFRGIFEGNPLSLVFFKPIHSALMGNLHWMTQASGAFICLALLGARALLVNKARRFQNEGSR